MKKYVPGEYLEKTITTPEDKASFAQWLERQAPTPNKPEPPKADATDYFLQGFNGTQHKGRGPFDSPRQQKYLSDGRTPYYYPSM